MTSELFVWIWLPQAVEPVVCGRLWAESGMVRFIYGRSYRARRDAIALMPERMPLDERIHLARRAGQVPAAIADAAPDAWGRRVIEYRRKSGELPELDYLADSRGDRIGALHFQTQADRFVPSTLAPARLDDLLQAAEVLERQQPLPAELAAALEHGTSIGGARPKATLMDGHRPLIAKFSSTTDRWSVVRAEWACMRLAARCGIRTAATSLVSVAGKDVLLVERFDREPAASGALLRRSMLSALTLLDLDDTEARLASYPALAELLHRLAANGRDDARQLFRRMVFNILVGNTDDHAKNHAAFWDGQWLRLTPAYDLLPMPRVGQEAAQAMQVGAAGRTATMANALSEAGRFALTPSQAREIVDEVEATIAAHWRSEFQACEVPQPQIDRLDGVAILSPVARLRTPL
ncbi:type II toxin-antitoxin system HipA family toxin [Solimonas marina]|uniref:HipA domain-containing protein n=1 Tax=Solimonas marina TaxID=2714601 RepID=A0A969WHH5_9GAMM|nr:HipA domain-containing protein [Solimonas marina]NKF24765.1 HipA domain-containing protein [Solimonas marina]